MTTDQINQQIQDLYQSAETYRSARLREYTQAITPYLKDVVDPTQVDINVRVSYQLSVDLTPKDCTFTSSDLCSFFFKMTYSDETETEYFSDINLNYYTTNADVNTNRGKYEFKRLMVLGKVAEVIYTHSNELISAVQAVYDRYKPQDDKYYKRLNELNTQLRQAEEVERNQEYNNFLAKAQHEITFPGIVTIDISNPSAYRPQRYNIKSFQIVDVTSSGKTYTIRFGAASWHYPDQVHHYTQKVKADKLKSIYYQDLKDFIV